MADGISVAASIFSQAGVKIEDFIALVGTATSVTQRSGSEIARGLRTVVLTLQGVTDADLDVTEDSISKAEEVLNKYGIAVRDSVNTLRDPMEVFEEISQKFQTTLKNNEVAQSEITQRLAGKRQANIFASIVNNWDMVQKQVGEALNSSGSAMRENAIYMDSWEAKSKQLSATVTKFWQNSLDTDLIKGFVSGMTLLVDALGNLQRVTLLVATGFALWKGSIVTLKIEQFFKLIAGGIRQIYAFIQANTVATASTKALGVASKTASISIKALSTAMKTNWVGLLLTGLTLAVTAMDLFGNKSDDLRESLVQSNKEYQETENRLKSLTDEYTKNFELAKTDENAKQQLISTELQLRKELSDTNLALDSQNKTMKENVDIIKKASNEKLKAYLRENQASAELMEQRRATQANAGRFFTFGERLDLGGTQGFLGDFLYGNETYDIEKVNNELKKILDNQGEYISKQKISIEQMEVLQEVQKRINKELNEENIIIEGVNKAKRQLAENSEEVLASQQKLSDEQLSIFNTIKEQLAFEDENTFEKTLLNVSNVLGSSDMTNVVQLYNNLDKISGINMDAIRDSLLDILSKTSDNVDISNVFKKTLDDVDGAAESLINAYEEMNDEGELSNNTIKELISNYPELISNLEVEGNVVKINTDLLEQKFNTQKNLSIQELNLIKKNLEAKKNATIESLTLMEGEIIGIKSVQRAYNEYNNELYGPKAKQQPEQKKGFSGFTGGVKSLLITEEEKQRVEEQVAKDKETKRKLLDDINTNIYGYDKKVSEINKIIEKITGTQLADYEQKDDKKKTKKTESLADLEYDKFEKLKKAIKDVNAELTKNQRLTEDADTYEEKTKLIKERQDILNKAINIKTSPLTALANAQRNEIESLIGSLGKYGVSVEYVRDKNEVLFTNLQDVEQQIKGTYSIEEANKLIETINDLTGKIIELNDENISLGDEWWSKKADLKNSLKEIEDLQKEILDNFKDAQSELTDLLEEQVEKRKDLVEEEYDNLKESIQEVMDEIDRQANDDDYNKSLKKQQDRLTDIAKKKANLLLAVKSGDLEAISKYKDLEEDEKEEQEKLDELQADRRLEIRKESLEQLENLAEKEKDKELDRIDEVFNKQNVAVESTKMLFATTLNGFQALYNDFISKLGDIDSITKTEMQNKANTVYEGIKGLTKNLSMSASGEIVTPKSQLETYMLSKNERRGSYDFKKYITAKYMATKEHEQTGVWNPMYSTAAQNIRDYYGLTNNEGLDNLSFADVEKYYKGFSDGGINTQEGLYALHGTKTKPEFILNYDQMKGFLGNYSSMLKNIVPNKSDMYTNNNSNFTLHVGKLVEINGSADSNTVNKLNEYANKIVDMTVGKIKKELNRSGQTRFV